MLISYMDDDNFSSNFPSQLSDDLFQFTYAPLPQHTSTISQSIEIPMSPLYEFGAEGQLKIPESSHSELAQKSLTDITKDGHQQNQGESKKKKEKKASHRDIEKQRRQEMSTLYRSLRSQLPIEFLKGRRSVSDHIHESVNYIMYLKNNIKELNQKRDQLKMLQSMHNLESISDKKILSQRGRLENVRVTPSWPGVEVACETNIRQGISLCRLIQILFKEEELNVVGCVSTKVNERFLHTIKAEVSQGRTMDLFQLQQKLSNLYI